VRFVPANTAETAVAQALFLCHGRFGRGGESLPHWVAYFTPPADNSASTILFSILNFTVTSVSFCSTL